MSQHNESIEDVLPPIQPEKRGLSPALVLFLLLPLIGISIAAVLILTEPDPSAASSNNGIAGSVSNSGAAVRLPGVVNNPVPETTLTTLTGDPVDLLGAYAGRVVFLNFWATWCVPCVKELPTFQTFAEAQGDGGAVVVAVNSSETVAQIEQFLSKNQLVLPDVQFLLDPNYNTYQRFGIYNMPTTYVINADGVVVSVKFGEMTLETMQAYLLDAQ